MEPHTHPRTGGGARLRRSATLLLTAALCLGSVATPLAAGAVTAPDPGGVPHGESAGVARASTELEQLLTSPPGISGEVMPGHTVSAETEGWGPAPIELAYQWLLDGEAIAGETSRNYAVRDEDGDARIPHQLQVRVTASKPGYETVVRSSQTVGVGKGRLTPIAEARITGEAMVGRPLSVTAPGFAPAATSISYDWYCAGALVQRSSLTFRPRAADSGKRCEARYTAVRAGYLESAGASPSVTVADAPFDSTPAPSLLGAWTVGSTLNVVGQPWVPYPDAVSYEWIVDGQTVAMGPNLTSFRLETWVAGKTVQLRMTGWKNGYVTTSRSSELARISAELPGVPFDSAPVPQIDGIAKVGAELTLQAGEWLPAPELLEAHWLRNGMEIPGANGQSYRLTAADAGTEITVRITASKPGYLTVQRTAAPMRVAAAPRPTQPLKRIVTKIPRLSGSAKVGTRLRVQRIAWNPAGVKLSYRWKRNGVLIPGAHASGYRVTRADRGKRITVIVTASKAGYATASRSSHPKKVR